MNEEYSMALEVSNPENYTPLLEYYQGKTKELLKCEGYLREIIKQIKDFNNRMNTDLINTVREVNPISASNKWNKLLCEELRKLLKVKEVNIYWDSGMINAKTYPTVSILIPYYKHAYLSGKSTNLKIHVFVYDNLVTMANFNEQELLAVILHELGHNFYYCPLLIASQVFISIVTFGIIPLQLFLNKTLNIVGAKLDSIVRDTFPFITNIFDTLSNYDTDFMYLSQLWGLPRFVYRFISGKALIDIPDSIEQIVYRLSGYGNETGADSFAAMYGYGPDLASALRKFEIVENTTYGKIVSNTGAIGSIYHDMIMFTTDIIGMMMMDPHPSHNQRASNVLKKLKKDLNTGNYPPNAKKDLEEQISRMEKAFVEVTKNSSNSNVQVRKTWYEVINKITAGNTDFRQMFKFYFDSFTF